MGVVLSIRLAIEPAGSVAWKLLPNMKYWSATDRLRQLLILNVSFLHFGSLRQ